MGQESHKEEVYSSGIRSKRLIAIGASTGGTVALNQIFRELRPDLPPIIIIQHMPALYTADFADTLSKSSQIVVSEARDGQFLLQGTAVVVPGEKNLAVKRSGAGYIVKISLPDPKSFYKPSIDFALASIAKEAKKEALGIILTGMGSDGAKGLREMFDEGALTLAQDEQSSANYGMPRKAIECGGVRKVVSLENISKIINDWGHCGVSDLTGDYQQF